MINPGIIGAASLASVGYIPFAHDANTLWWDFNNIQNTTEATGVDTFSFVPERISGINNLWQPNKALQPLDSTNGANFNKDTPRQMYLENVEGITNGKSGWYMACNVYFETGDGNVMSIARNSSSAASRGEIYLTSSRNFALKAASNDGGTLAFVGYTSALSLTTWYTLEMLFEVVAGVGELTIWVNGVQQTLSVDNNPAFVNFPSTDSSEIVIGNLASTDIDSLDGELQQLIFYNGVPSSTIRDSVQTYLIGVKP